MAKCYLVQVQELKDGTSASSIVEYNDDLQWEKDYSLAIVDAIDDETISVLRVSKLNEHLHDIEGKVINKPADAVVNEE